MCPVILTRLLLGCNRNNSFKACGPCFLSGQCGRYNYYTLIVSDFAYLLDSLEGKVQHHEKWKSRNADKREMIGDVSYSSVQALKREYGKNISLLEFMELMNKQILDNENAPYTVQATLLVMSLGQ